MADKAQDASRDEAVDQSPTDSSAADELEVAVQAIEISDGGFSDAERESDADSGPDLAADSEGIEDAQADADHDEENVEGEEQAPLASVEVEAAADNEDSADDIPYSYYPESQYFHCLDEELLPNSSIPMNLSHAEDVGSCTNPDADWDLHEKVGSPEATIRVCRSPDTSRPVMIWKVYEDLKHEFPDEANWADPPKPDGSWPYTIEPIPGKGNGMIATRDIQRGETLLVERPILMFPIQAGTWEEMENDFAEMVQHLDPEDQQVLQGLRNCKVQRERSELLGMLFTNVMKCAFLQSAYCPGYSGLSVDGCRANHR